MTANILEHITATDTEAPFTLALKSPRGRVTEIIIVREQAQMDRTSAPVGRPLTLLPDFDDDLANATWEDAEWR
jgi:hypothetical protein